MNDLAVITVAVGLAAAGRWWRREQRRRRWMRQLSDLSDPDERPAGECAPPRRTGTGEAVSAVREWPAAAHLPSGLARLAEQARTLRLQLATPLSSFAELPWGDSPWGRRSRCDAYDLALVNVRRAIWDWLKLFEGLQAHERALLGELGLSPRRVAATLFAPGVFDRTEDPWEEVLYPAAPDLERLARALYGAMTDLRHFEAALLAYRPAPYR